jgi:uncharacterized protein YqjF (DUF2071 family)
VRLPVNIHYWDNISLLHWPFAPDDIKRLVPQQLEVLTYDGMAWLSVTPFFIRVRLPGPPSVPPPCAFPETNRAADRRYRPGLLIRRLDD